MKNLKRNLLFVAIGASSSLTGLAALSRCGGGNCSSCFGCAGVGLAFLLISLSKRFMKKKEGEDGIVQRID